MFDCTVFILCQYVFNMSSICLQSVVLREPFAIPVLFGQFNNVLVTSKLEFPYGVWLLQCLYKKSTKVFVVFIHT